MDKFEYWGYEDADRPIFRESIKKRLARLWDKLWGKFWVWCLRRTTIDRFELVGSKRMKPTWSKGSAVRQKRKWQKEAVDNYRQELKNQGYFL